MTRHRAMGSRLRRPWLAAALAGSIAAAVARIVERGLVVEQHAWRRRVTLRFES